MGKWKLHNTSNCFSFMYSASQMSLFGLTLSADSVYGSVLVNFAVLGLVDAFANVILSGLAKFISRRTLNITSFLCMALCFLIVGFLRLFAPEQEIISC